MSLVAEIWRLGPTTIAVDAIQYHGLASLLEASPVTVSGIAELSGLSFDKVEDGIHAIGIPAALGLTATVETCCAHCGEPISVDVADEGLDLAATVDLGHAMWGRYRRTEYEPPAGG